MGALCIAVSWRICFASCDKEMQSNWLYIEAQREKLQNMRTSRRGMIMSNKAIMNNYCVILIKPNGRTIVRNLISIIASSETIHELISESTGYPKDNVIVLGYSLHSAGEPVLLGDLFRIAADEN